MLFVVGIDSIEDVMSIRQKAIELLKGGMVISDWSSESLSFRKTFGLPLDKILQEANIFLKQAAPDLFGRRIRRTRVVFTE